MITTRSKWCAAAFAAANAASSFFSCAGLAAPAWLYCGGLFTCAGWWVCALFVDCPREPLETAQNRDAAVRQIDKTIIRERPPGRETPCLSDILVTDSHTCSSNRIQRSPDGPTPENPHHPHRTRRVPVQERRGRSHLCGEGEEPAQPRRQLLPRRPLGGLKDRYPGARSRRR